MLYTVDAQTGELSQVGNTGFKEVEDLAFGSDGTLWAWAKGNGMITIDLATGAGELVIVSDVKLEALTLDKNNEHTIFYGAVDKELWVYNQDTAQLEVACTNLLGETEALEMMDDGTLLIGTDKSETFYAFDAKTCQTLIEVPIPYDDVEGIAFPIKACAE